MLDLLEGRTVLSIGGIGIALAAVAGLTQLFSP